MALLSLSYSFIRDKQPKEVKELTDYLEKECMAILKSWRNVSRPLVCVSRPLLCVSPALS